MNRQEAETIIKVCLDAVNEQYVIPLMLGLGTLTATLACRDPDAAPAIAASLREQAESCPPDVAGRVLLQALAQLADAPGTPRTPKEMRAILRLVQGGKPEPTHADVPPVRDTK